MHLHYDVAGPGDGHPLVLAGPIATTLGIWDRQAATLCKDYRVIRYDHRGHGLSAVPPGPYSIADLGADILGLLDSLGVDVASFCGLSLGGMVGMWLAAHAPERIDRLVLSATSPKVDPAVWDERIAAVREHGTGVLLDATLTRWLTAETRETRGDEAARVSAMISATPDAGYVGCSQAIAAMDLRPELSLIGAPTLFVVGSADRSMPVTEANEMAGVIRAAGGEAHVEVVEGAAHLVNVDRPEVFTSLLAQHFR